MELNGATLLPLVGDVLKAIIGASANYDASTIRNLEGDLKSLSQEITGYLLKKNKGDETAEELYELAQSRMDIIDTRIKLIKGNAQNLQTKEIITAVVNMALKMAVL